MKENKINWWLIIGIVVVVAVIASLVTLQFTGNAIKLTNSLSSTDRNFCYKTCLNETGCGDLPKLEIPFCKAKCSASCSNVEVYTKAEVDALVSKPVVINSVLLNPGQQYNSSCSIICNSWDSRICRGAFMQNWIEKNSSYPQSYEMINCDSNFISDLGINLGMRQIQCMCA